MYDHAARAKRGVVVVEEASGDEVTVRRRAQKRKEIASMMRLFELKS